MKEISDENQPLLSRHYASPIGIDKLSEKTNTDIFNDLLAQAILKLSQPLKEHKIAFNKNKNSVAPYIVFNKFLKKKEIYSEDADIVTPWHPYVRCTISSNSFPDPQFRPKYYSPPYEIEYAIANDKGISFGYRLIICLAQENNDAISLIAFENKPTKKWVDIPDPSCRGKVLSAFLLTLKSFIEPDVTEPMKSILTDYQQDNRDVAYESFTNLIQTRLAAYILQVKQLNNLHQLDSASYVENYAVKFQQNEMEIKRVEEIRKENLMRNKISLTDYERDDKARLECKCSII